MTNVYENHAQRRNNIEEEKKGAHDDTGAHFGMNPYEEYGLIN